jgi:DNA mismatch endonuclease (patch repair protein)
MKTTKYRSKMMSKIHSTGGKAETILGKAIWHKGIRYFRNYKKLPGKPDLAITKYKIAVFVDGEYWHGYNYDEIKSGKRVHRNREYWLHKISYNMNHDKEVNAELEKRGWTVIRFWERHQVLKNLDDCVNEITAAISKQRSEMNIPKSHS